MSHRRRRDRSDPLLGTRWRWAQRIVLGWLVAGCIVGVPRLGSAEGDLQGAILVLLDTLRADHLRHGGYGRATSPSLDALAARGVVFDQAISYAPWTLPAAVALFSGRWGDTRAYDPETQRLRRSFVENFAAAGLTTAAFTEGGYVSKHFGFDLGFDSYVEEEGPVRLVRKGETAPSRKPGSIDRTFAKAIEWLRSHREERFFLLIHTYEPHTPYERSHFTKMLRPGRIGPVLHSEHLKKLQTGQIELSDAEVGYVTALYDGGVLEADRHIGKLVEALQQAGLAQKTLLAVSSDHGEELGDHYRSFTGDHGHSLYDELVRVPLLIHDPRKRYPVQRVSAQVRSIDILPTLAELLGVPRTLGVEGRSAVPLMRGDETEGRIAFGGAVKVAPRRHFVRYLGFKYVEAVSGDTRPSPLSPAPAPVELYDLDSDPLERHNLAAERPELVSQFKGWLETHRAEAGGGTPLSSPNGSDLPEALRERLRSLGYLE